MENNLNCVPEQYVGLLQNGPDWIAVMRKVVRGRVCWTYVQASSAFTIDNASTKSTINEEQMELSFKIYHLSFKINLGYNLCNLLCSQHRTNAFIP